MRDKCDGHSQDCTEGYSQHQTKTWTHAKNRCRHDYVLPFLVMLVCPTETGVVLSPCLITAHDSRPIAPSCSVLARRPSSPHDEEGHATIWLPRASKRYSFGCQQATSLHLELRGGNVRISDDEDKHASGMEASEHADREKAPTEALDTGHKAKAKKEDKNEANEMIVSFHDALWLN
jgi:hypothetical protein